MSGTKFTTTSLTPAATTKFAAELADGSKGHVLGSALGIYTEGTFTPVLTFGTPGDLSVTYAAGGQVGTYIKIGNLVIATVNINTSAFTHATASGNLTVTGLPFTSKNVTGDVHTVHVFFQGITKANYTAVQAFLSPNTTSVLFTASGSAQAAAVLASADVPSGGTPALRFTLVYHAA